MVDGNNRNSQSVINFGLARLVVAYARTSGRPSTKEDSGGLYIGVPKNGMVNVYYVQGASESAFPNIGQLSPEAVNEVILQHKGRFIRTYGLEQKAI